MHSTRVRCLSLSYLLCMSKWRTAWHARASVFCHRRTPTPRTHNILYTKMCANYANLRQVRQVNWKLKTNCKFAYRSIVARFLRRTRCKYQKKKQIKTRNLWLWLCYKKLEIQYNRKYRYRKSIVNSANDFFIFFKYLFTHFQCQLARLPRRVA